MAVLELSRASSPNLPIHREYVSFSSISQERMMSPEDEMRLLGISSKHEFERFCQVSAVAGQQIAIREVGRNLVAYEREFLQDIPISAPHTYFHRDGELFSEENQHPLFHLRSQLDPREREGRTLVGFEKFEKKIIQSRVADGVSVWYSPAGKAGSTGPFKDIFFDAGRLYLAFNNNNDSSTHIDVKINEKLFPIRELLTWIQYCAEGKRTSEELPLEEFGAYFLQNPIDTKMNQQDFMAFLKDFMSAYDGGQAVYVARRNSTNPDAFTLGRMYEELEEQLKKHFDQSENASRKVQGHHATSASGLPEIEIQKMYMAAIQDYARKNGGRVELYGCSTTSSFDLLENGDGSSLYFGQAFGYSSWDRLVGGSTDLLESRVGCGKAGCSIRNPHFHCPTKKEGGCGGHIPSGKGLEQCPHCGLKKSDYRGEKCD